MTQSLNIVDELIPTIVSAIEEWKTTHTPENIKKSVAKHLDSDANEILLKLLGFNKRWSDGWELDHCNGRSGNSTAGDYLKRVQQEAINDWLKQVKLPEMPASIKKSLQTAMREKYSRELKTTLLNLVQQKAEKDAAELMKSIIGANGIDNYIKTVQLIDPHSSSAA